MSTYIVFTKQGLYRTLYEAEKKADQYIREYGEDHPATTRALLDLRNARESLENWIRNNGQE